MIVSHDQTIARHVDRVVAIRDGKTSSETVRQSVTVQAPAKNGGADLADGEAEQVEAPKEEITYEEVTLLDAAGRLQIPREYLEHFAIQRRVFVEMVENGILIRPAPVSERETALVAATNGKAVQAEKENPLRGLLGRLRKAAPRRKS
jgi:bifunctional DNA-binding transcriptional regulator/antitoxin component of YhaV-PrlF toxin-antitoxin module